ncbi:CrcB family protein [Bifidobacterium sp. SMB2]|uniref:Fluoride-specific ion channel FluC n=1 Tax=Bifidobacterium saimiriisciurei TaxID=2661627 RepID=A0ABX0CG44_9BIFI|nr:MULTISPECIES: CrcB family protein [Bifidobacterium]NEG95470.1 CrcB family protein [Bifidobacterium sp. SMB2]NEH11628.1 CrcB family protein [Bifidobacterium saimiriisciurei]
MAEAEPSQPGATSAAASARPNAAAPSVAAHDGTNTPKQRPALADSTLYLVVFLGGCLGTGMRYGLSLTNAATVGTGADADAAGAGGVWSAIHLGTFTANIVACFVYAALSAYLSQATWIRKRSRDVISRGFGMGMCGGLSTMSTLAFEQFGDLARGNIFGVLIYVVLSFGVGLMAAYLGVRLALAIAGHKAGRAGVDSGDDDSGDDDSDSGASPVVAPSVGDTPAVDTPAVDTSGLPPTIAAKMAEAATSGGVTSSASGAVPVDKERSAEANADNPRTLWTDDDTSSDKEGRR